MGFLEIMAGGVLVLMFIVACVLWGILLLVIAAFVTGRWFG